MRFYTEPTVELVIYPPQINIEFSALYLPEQFTFDARDLYNVTVGTDRKLHVKMATIAIILEHFSPAFHNFDADLAKLTEHAPQVGLSQANIENFYGRQLTLWGEGLTSLMRLEAASKLGLEAVDKSLESTADLLNIAYGHEKDQPTNVYDVTERTATKRVMGPIYSSEKILVKS